MQRRVRFVDLVTARYAPSPNIAELIEPIDPAAGDEDQIMNRGQRCLQKSGDLFGFVADERRPE